MKYFLLVLKVFGLLLLIALGIALFTNYQQAVEWPIKTTSIPSQLPHKKPEQPQNPQTQYPRPKTHSVPTQAPATPTQQSVNKTEKLLVVSWNLQNLGKSKTHAHLSMAAQLLKDYDLVAIQEITTSLSGANTLSKLVDELDRTGNNWDYVLSPRTSGRGTERYAYIWKAHKLTLNNHWLVKANNIDETIDREPYMGRFTTKSGNSLLVANFHAVPAAKKPATEISQLDQLQKFYTNDNLIIVGDFNLAQSNYAFDKLKKLAFKPALVGERTTIKHTRKNNLYLANAYDNIFYNSKHLRNNRSGVIDFVHEFSSLHDARLLSDHLPVWIELQWQ